MTPEQRQPFLDHEQTTTAAATLTVDPSLPAGADATPPWVHVTRISGQLVDAPQAALAITANANASWMFLREWKPDPTTGAWTAVQDSGWLDFQALYTPTLTAGLGVHYLGVWVRDTGRQCLDAGQGRPGLRQSHRRQPGAGRRSPRPVPRAVEQNAWVVPVLTTLAGDPDMYIWEPFNGFQADHYINESVAPGQTESAGGKLTEPTGLALLDVLAVGASEYQLSFAQDVHQSRAARSPRASCGRSIPLSSPTR